MKKRMPKDKVGEYVYLSKPTSKMLKKYCKDHKRTKSALVETAIEYFINQHTTQRESKDYVEFG